MSSSSSDSSVSGEDSPNSNHGETVGAFGGGYVRTTFTHFDTLPGDQLKPEEYHLEVLKPRYTQLELIGTGAYGQVFKAQDTQENKEVAIKFMKTILSDNLFSRKVVRELSILAHLSKMNGSLFSTKLLDIVWKGSLSPPNDFVFLIMEKEEIDFYEHLK